MKIYLTKEAELKAKVLQLETKIARLKSELEYHEAFALEGDGRRCEECGAVRQLDDCIEVGDFHCCSQECAQIIQQDIIDDLNEQLCRIRNFETIYRS